MIEIDNNGHISIMALDVNGMYKTYYFINTEFGWKEAPQGKVSVKQYNSQKDTGYVFSTLVTEINGYFIVDISQISPNISGALVSDSIQTEFKVLENGIGRVATEGRSCYLVFAILDEIPDNYEIYVNDETIRVN